MAQYHCDSSARKKRLLSRSSPDEDRLKLLLAQPTWTPEQAWEVLVAQVDSGLTIVRRKNKLATLAKNRGSASLSCYRVQYGTGTPEQNTGVLCARCGALIDTKLSGTRIALTAYDVTPPTFLCSVVNL